LSLELINAGMLHVYWFTDKNKEKYTLVHDRIKIFTRDADRLRILASKEDVVLVNFNEKSVLICNH